MLTPNELILPFGGSYVCANFGENRSRNATVRLLADRQTDTPTHWLTDANRFYNRPMLYAIAMRQIKISPRTDQRRQQSKQQRQGSGAIAATCTRSASRAVARESTEASIK